MPTTTTGKATEFINFSRASNATVVDSDGKIKWAPHNLLLASEQFDASAWPKNAITVTANSVVAPNGTTTADTMLDTAATIIHWTGQYITSPSPAGLTFTVSAFVKANTLNYATLGISDISVGNLFAVAVFNLSNGTIATTGASGTGYSVVGTPTIVSAGSGWYLCSVTVVAGTSTSFLNAVIGLNKTGIISANAGGFESYLGNGSGIYLWGAACYRSDLGGMVSNTSAYPLYNPTTPKNLLGYSEDFTIGAHWVLSQTLAFGSGSVANAAIAPNGLQTADLVVPNTTSSIAHAIYAPVTLRAAPTTFSVYAKQGGYGYAMISVFDGSHKTSVFDLVNGTVSQTAAGGSASIISVGNGWYRCSITLTTLAAAGVLYYGAVNAASWTYGTTTFSGDGTSGIYLWGAQLSDSASLDPYVANHFAAPSAAAYYGPRLDYSAAGAALGLLVEEQRTNFLLGSDQFNNVSYWLPLDATVTANNTSSPDGTTNADRIVFTTTAGVVLQDYSTTTAGTYTASVYLRADSSTTVNLRIQQSGGTSATVVCSLTTSWQRFTISYTATAPTFLRFALLANSNTPTFYAYGAQLEAGSFATSYIPTGAATATRSADVAQVSTSAFPYSATEGTVVANVVALTTSYGVYLSDGAGANYITTRHGSTGTAYVVGVSSVLQANIGTAVLSGKTANAYKQDDFANSVNGGTVATDTSGTLPTINQMRLGASVDGSVCVNGWIRQITYIPRRLSNTELQTRTA